MPVTTALSACELNRSTGNAELDSLLADARIATGRNYQIVMRASREQKRVGLLRRTARIGAAPQLYVEVPGVFPWQVLQCARDEPTVFAYLYGVINGAEDTRRAMRGASD